MLSLRDKVALALLGLLCLGTLAVFFRTNPAPMMQNRAAGDQARLVDQTPLQTARNTAGLVATEEEAVYAREALRLADRSVDLAFSMALREAELNPPAENAQIKAISARVDELTKQHETDQEIVKDFAALAANPGSSDPAEVREQLETAKAQLSVSQDELEDARQSLITAGGDRQTRIQQTQSEYQAIQQTSAVQVQPKNATYSVPGSLISQVRGLRSLSAEQSQLAAAQQEAQDRAQALARKHEELFRQSQQSSSSSTHAEALALLHRQALEKKMLADYNKRMQFEQKLAQNYSDWTTLLRIYKQSVIHGIALSVLWLLLIVGAVLGVEAGVARFYHEQDRRKAGTMRMALRFTLQVGGILAILLVLFGPPNQLSTVIALAGAGLTVVLKDFILAFFAWFVLMGRNGIRVGDWVEINGIGGEVVEISILRTVILETGNWNDAGHPTGRKVAFVNSFAIEGHYFNFSTTGQWLWDELDVLVPSGKDVQAIADAVRKIVADATSADVAMAEQEWQRATRSNDMKSFSAAPAVDVRSTGTGVSVIVRYITRANVRYELRTRLNQAIVQLLHGHPSAALTQ